MRNCDRSAYVLATPWYVGEVGNTASNWPLFSSNARNMDSVVTTYTRSYRASYCGPTHTSTGSVKTREWTEVWLPFQVKISLRPGLTHAITEASTPNLVPLTNKNVRHESGCRVKVNGASWYDSSKTTDTPVLVSLLRSTIPLARIQTSCMFS